MTLQAPEPFQREYFDWSEEEFAQSSSKRSPPGGSNRNEAYLDLKMEKKSSGQKVKAAYQDMVNLPNLVKTLPGLAANPTPADYVRSVNNFLRDNRGRDLIHWWSKLRAGTKTPLFGSADIINVCNLKCVHCYWWTNREADGRGAHA